MYTAHQKIKTYSSWFSNNKALRTVLIKGIAKNAHLELMNAYKIGRRFSIGILGLGLLLTCLSFNNSSINNNQLYSNDLPTIHGTITQIKKQYTRKKALNKIHIKLQEYPDFMFTISDTELTTFLYSNTINEISNGQFIQINLLKDTYLKHITKAENLTLFEAIFDLEMITVKGLKTVQKTYISIEEVNKQQRYTNNLFVLGIISLALLLFGIILIIESTQKAIYRYPQNHLLSLPINTSQ